ncbi:MAG TPA: hypothetical protein VMN37_09300 [Gemmatimonadales bacterium]|nr:hypothetical protein [Gemmatimonadales bacterium]
MEPAASGLVLGVFHLYQLETPLLRRLLLLAVGGFAVHPLIPVAGRLRFFVGLSVVGAVVAFGALDAAWLLGSGMLLIGVCHLPVRFAARVWQRYPDVELALTELHRQP